MQGQRTKLSGVTQKLFSTVMLRLSEMTPKRSSPELCTLKSTSQSQALTDEKDLCYVHIYDVTDLKFITSYFLFTVEHYYKIFAHQKKHFLL